MTKTTSGDYRAGAGAGVEQQPPLAPWEQRAAGREAAGGRSGFGLRSWRGFVVFGFWAGPEAGDVERVTFGKEGFIDALLKVES